MNGFKIKGMEFIIYGFGCVVGGRENDCVREGENMVKECKTR